MTVPTHYLPSFEELYKWLSYDPAAGTLRWKIDRNYNAKAGTEAGCVCPTTGYRRVRFGGKRKIQAHRIAWVLMHKKDPYPLEVDHIDGNRLNSKASNLRLVSRKQNQINRTRLNKNNTTGYCGVYPHGNKWRAAIRFNDRLSYLGLYDTKEEASRAWAAANSHRVHLSFNSAS